MKRFTGIPLILIITAFAYGAHAPAYADRNLQPCKSLISEIAGAPAENFEFKHRSFQSTFVTSLLMFNFVHALRTAATGEKFFTPAYNVTLPTDILLTLTTHAINLSNIKFLKRIFDGSLAGPKLEPHLKILANALLGIGYIHASWVASDVHITPGKACLSAALCAVVYPTLYFVKTRLFKRLPLRRDRNRLLEFQAHPIFGEAFKVLEADVKLAARSTKLTEEEAELLSLTFIENLLNDLKIEERVQESLLNERSDIQSLVTALRGEKDLWKSRSLRHDLRKKLISIFHDSSTDARIKTQILSLLHLGDPFTYESSLAFHEAMLKRAQSQVTAIWASSLLDQSISVGIAGGLGMYYVNEYAVHQF